MDHEFSPSLTDSKKCIHCKRSVRDHSIIAQCEACPKIGKCELFTDMLLCASCYAAEMKAVADYQAPELQEARLEQHRDQLKLNDLITDSLKIDQSIKLVTDIFNAKTVALVDIMKSIEEDAAVDNKPFAKAEYSVNRIKHLTKVIFDLKTQLTESENEIRANQVNVNMLINGLRNEEREKLKLQDINYQPASPKQAKPKSSGTAKVKKSTKVDMVEVNKWATKVGISGTALHMTMIQHGFTPEAAARHFAKILGKDID